MVRGTEIGVAYHLTIMQSKDAAHLLGGAKSEEASQARHGDSLSP